MEHPNEPTAVRNEPDVMDVSPTVHPDTTIVSENNKENDDADFDNPNSMLSTVAPPPATNTVPQTESNPSANLPAQPPADPDAEPRETQFAYVLRKYNAIPENRIYSPWHLFGGFKWRLLIFPRGNHTTNNDISVYLESGGPISREEQQPTQSAQQQQQHQQSTQHQQHQHQHPITSPNGKGSVLPAPPPATWSRPAKFSLHLVHPTSPVAHAALASQPANADPADVDMSLSEATLSDAAELAPGQKADLFKETQHIFRHNASDWGFLEFAPFSNLQPDNFADSDMNIVIMVKIRLQDASPDPVFPNTPTYDSRKETGLVGFKNQGATCYMNSLLQTLYMVSAFRKAVYSMPLPEPGNENSGSELSYALQKVFYELQTSPTVVKTKKLTESFGWDTTDAFTQHDVQELKLILCDELAEKMKKIKPDEPNTLSILFQGKLLNYIECVNVPYKSTRDEEFSDLSVNVKGCQNIYDSFEKYIEVEMMEGDNKYRADGFDELQDAKKGVKFLKLPPVLQLHLKRFEYDTTRDAMVKINDRYEFEPEIDLSRFVEDSDGTDVYVLHSVLVHIGDVNGGHYHAFIRPHIDVSDEEPKKPSQWYKFDDETVSRASEEEAVLHNYGVGGEKDASKRGGLDDDNGNVGINGGQNPPPSMFQTRNRNYPSRRFSNAYMLQYLRKSEVPYLLKPQAESDVPPELAERINKEREEEEQRKRDNEEQHLYMTISVATADEMISHHGPDLVNWDKMRPLRVKRAMLLGDLKQLLQNEGIVKDARRMRLWRCQSRRNHSLRPDSLLAKGDDSQPIEPVGRDPLVSGNYNSIYSGRQGYYGNYDDTLKLFAEDFCSKYCLDAGIAYKEFEKLTEKARAKSMESETVDGTVISKKMTDQELRMLNRPYPFSLVSGVETLIFVKYYSSSPSPRLQLLGHVVVDRKTLVKDLHPFLRNAVEVYDKEDPSISLLPDEAPLIVCEELSATKTPILDESKSLEHHKIPWENGAGDIIVFQMTPNGFKSRLRTDGEDDEPEMPEDPDEWNGYQEISRGDGTDLPLGGRPLEYVKMYYNYFAYRIKIEFKDRLWAGTPDEGKSIIFEVLRKDDYRRVRKILCGALGDDVNPDFLRFFGHDFNRDAPAQETFRFADDDPLERFLPTQNLVSGGQMEYRTIWFERTEYHIKEFDQKDEVRVVWRADGGARSTRYVLKNGGTSGGLSRVSSENGGMHESGSETAGRTEMSVDGEEGKSERETDDSEHAREIKSVTTKWNGNANGDMAKWFSVLVPLTSNYADVMDQVRIKLGVRGDVDIRMFEIKNSRILRFVDPRESLPSLITGAHDYGAELRAEPVPHDETVEELGEEYELMSVVHLAKDKSVRMWRGPSYFGEPFVVKVRKKGETVRALRKRIQSKLGVPSEEFDTWPLAEIAQIKVIYLEDDALYEPRLSAAIEFCTLAIEHKSVSTPKRVNNSVSRYADKPLRIRS